MYVSYTENVSVGTKLRKCARLSLNMMPSFYKAHSRLPFCDNMVPLYYPLAFILNLDKLIIIN